MKPHPTPMYAVIFRTLRDLPVPQSYAEFNAKLAQKVKTLEGFVSIYSVGNDKGEGVSISYWKSLGAIKAWKAEQDHMEAQRLGQTRWYRYYKVEICEVLESREGGTDL